MPSRLIQGFDNFDTCSQFSDSATLHTLTRIGALEKEIYFSRSESNFNNFDTISYGNSSTCCCDAEIKMDLQLKNSIYQCNPRCAIEKQSVKNHSRSQVKNELQDFFKPIITSRAGCDVNSKRNLQRSNYSFEMNTNDIDIEAIPLPPSVLNRYPASFRKPYMSPISTLSTSHNMRNPNKTRENEWPSTNKSKEAFKLYDTLSNKEKRFVRLDSEYEKFGDIRSENLLPMNNRFDDQRFDTENFAPSEPFSINAFHMYHDDLLTKNQPLALNVNELKDSSTLSASRSMTLADLQSVHASTCNLVTALRLSNQSVVGGLTNQIKDFSENRKIGYRCNSSTNMHLKYGSLRSNKARTKRSNSEQLNSSYYHFKNLDSEIDNNHGALDSVLIPNSIENQKLPWKHRLCSSSSSSASSISSNIAKWSLAKHWLAITSIILIAGAAGVAVPLALRVTSEASFDERLQSAIDLLKEVPLIDGHNDLPYNIRKFVHNQLSDFEFDVDLKVVPPWSSSNWSHTDLKRLKLGKVSAQFWAAYVPCEAQYKDAVQITLEQIDVIIRLTTKYPNDLTICTSSKDIMKAHEDNKICSLIGVEGGHSISGSLSVLRMFYMLGVRYMTLTSTCHTPWADSSNADAPRFDVQNDGLTDFGKQVIKEMNRLGMVVDLSHVSLATMSDAISTSEAPVIFSHSSAYEICNSSRNVQDSILKALAKNRGIIMLNFYSMFLNCEQNATVSHAVAHLDHIKQVSGVDHVGIGAGYDGINYTPIGLEDASKYPVLFAELIGHGWSVEELTKLASGNILRVLSEVEAVRDKKNKDKILPREDILSNRFENPFKCQSI